MKSAFERALVSISASNFSVHRLQNSSKIPGKNRAGQSLATVTTEKPRFGDIVAIFAIGVLQEIFATR